VALNANDCVLALPTVVCPSCRAHLETSNTVNKLSNEQITARTREQNRINLLTSAQSPDETRSSDPEHIYFIVSCTNSMCDQYSRIKIFEWPRIRTKTATVALD
jgi:hypothetical protein